MTERGRDKTGAATAMNTIKTLPTAIDRLVPALEILIVDDNQFMRKVVRNILVNLGVKTIYEATDGITGLEAIRTYSPDIVIVDWEMPLLNGAEMVRIIRSPDMFPCPDIPIIMLSGHGERWRVVEAMRLGVNEFLRKPVSGSSLLNRLQMILLKPRPMVRLPGYYGPEPRRDQASLMGVRPGSRRSGQTAA
jgi:CheY-like chemotaxis protein